MRHISRKGRKGRVRIEFEFCGNILTSATERTRLDNPVRRKFAAKRAAAQADGAVLVPGPKRPAVRMPDEYLPPNKILFLQNLPENVTKDQLTALFSQYDSFCRSHVIHINNVLRYPNLYEVRLIPTKKDIAFVEYMDENSASVAKDALHNYKLDGEGKIKVRLNNFIHLS